MRESDREGRSAPGRASMDVDAPAIEATSEVIDEAYRRIITSDRRPTLSVEQISAAAPEPPMRGLRLVIALDDIFLRLQRLARDAVPNHLNPLLQIGAVANTALLVAIVTGVLLLLWYVPSVVEAYGSVVDMGEKASIGGFVRSLHRYSSDACMFFVVVHALQTLGARKVGRTRWIGWVSGLVMVGLLWFDGWTGYWLVWDERARQIALGTATMLDALPIFTDPIGRSFLTDETLNSLLFFVVFFVHMLVPLAMGIGVWIHVMRLNRARLFTGRPLTALMILVLVAISLVFPADAAEPARMAAVPNDLDIDGFFLLPLFLTDRLQGGLLWMVALLVSVALASLPWWIVRRRPAAAVVQEASCNGCTLCYEDCPFDAISMETAVGRHPEVARVDPARCVGCGICVGSCDTNAIDLPGLPVRDVRRMLNDRSKIAPRRNGPVLVRGGARLVDPASSGDGTTTGDGARIIRIARFGGEAQKGTGLQPGRGGRLDREDRTDDGATHVAFVCASSAGAELDISAEGTSTSLPGYRVVPVPCVGWVHMLMVERAIRHGARGVLLAGCGDDAACRLGDRWTTDRLNGKRAPGLREGKVRQEDVRYVRANRSERKKLTRAAQDFRIGEPDARPNREIRRGKPAGMAAALLIALGAVLLSINEVPYAAPGAKSAALVVSFKHAGEVAESEAAPGPAQSDLLPHMRSTGPTERVRVPVRLSVSIDGREVLARTYEPSGLFNDGSSVALERFAVSEGRHTVRVRMGETKNPDEWTFSTEREVEFVAGQRRVVMFDGASDFSWY